MAEQSLYVFILHLYYSSAAGTCLGCCQTIPQTFDDALKNTSELLANFSGMKQKVQSSSAKQ